jgi:Mg2+/Co2+ transporter CorB
MIANTLGQHIPEIVALVLLVAGSAFFSGSEAALISLSRLRARGMARRAGRGSGRSVARGPQ